MKKRTILITANKINVAGAKNVVYIEIANDSDKMQQKMDYATFSGILWPLRLRSLS